MIFSKLFNRKKQDNWENNKQYFKSTIDLKLLPEQVIYVEGTYDDKINKIVNEKYDEIVSKFKQSDLLADFIYLPFIISQLQIPNFSLIDILNYYFPNIYTQKTAWNIPIISQTESISRILFSVLEYKNPIKPGFFRYVGKNEEELFVYEYFSFKSSNKRSILRQIDYYSINVFSETKEDIFADEIQIFEEENCLPAFSDEEILKEPSEPYNEDIAEKKTDIYPKSKLFNKLSPFREINKSLFEEDDECSDNIPQASAESKSFILKEHELISQIKTDIQNLKDLGFYELLIKEIGSVLFEDEPKKIFQPSRLVMNNDFKIYLPDFNNMEIEMTPLPKALFILFLRHPQGINLKSLIDYKIELLEIYKLLSYRETYFNIVESIDRICNPFEGSINEKLSRVKEAFLKKMSMDTAKYYIIAGDRGQEKKIEIDRSLIKLPDAFEEINLTIVSEY